MPFFAEIIQHIMKTIMLYYLELNFKSIPNMQHYSYTHTKVHAICEIDNDFIRENTKKAFFEIFTSFHSKKFPKFAFSNFI